MINAKTTLRAAVGAAALSVASGASAASYLFTFQFDAFMSPTATFAASTIVFSADSFDPTTLTYVSGNLNGATAPTADLINFTPGSPLRLYDFRMVPPGAPLDTVVGGRMAVLTPTGPGFYGSGVAGRSIVEDIGIVTRFGTGSLVITEAIPEPSTWAMLILGFGAVGATMRRRAITTRLAFA